MADLTDKEVTDIVLEIAKEGGQLGRAIFYKICFREQDRDPKYDMKIMETILPQMPEQDRKVILFCLDEFSDGKRLDLRKLVEDRIQGAIRDHLLNK
jgi:hypothetical protein